MKILTVCEMGNKRSVVTRFLLEHDHDVIAIGVKTNSQETLMMLCQWADKILVAEQIMTVQLPGFYEKVDRDFTIGPDTYPSSIDKKLYRLVKAKLTELGYL